MRAQWTFKQDQATGVGQELVIAAKDVHGGPYVDKEADGSTSVTYYGKPGGKVAIKLSEAELAVLKEKLG